MELDSKVVGVTRHNHDGSDRQVIAGQCQPGEQLKLRREPDNPQDANAIAVFRRNRDQLGYLSASLAEKLAPLLDAGTRFTAVVSEVTGGTDQPYGVTIHIHDGAAAGNGKSTATADAPAPPPAEAPPRTRTRSAAPVQARRGCLFGIVAGIGSMMKWATGGERR